MNETSSTKCLIYTSGRSGSHILTHFFRSCSKFQKVVHSQEYYIPDDTENWILVISLRRSRWDQLCSKFVSSATREYGPYSIENPDVTLDIESLIDTTGGIIMFEKLSKYIGYQHVWKSVHTIYKEDITHQFLEEQFGVSSTTSFTQEYTSPHNYQKCITNYDEMKKEYEEKWLPILEEL